MPGRLEELRDAVEERITELKRLVQLRADDSAKNLCQQELKAIAACTWAVEQKLQELKSCIAAEQAAIPKVKALIEAAKLQTQHIDAVSANMPTRLPLRNLNSVQIAAPATSRLGAPGVKSADATSSGPAPATASGRGALGAANDEGGRRRKEPPRWYVTKDELANTPSYMRGRLQLDKLNAAVDELASHALKNQNLIAAFKAGSSKLAAPDRKRVSELVHNIANQEGVKGNSWLLDSDLREGVLVRHDNTGKSILAVLRHHGRIKEVRVNVDGVSTLVYVLLDDGRRAG